MATYPGSSSYRVYIGDLPKNASEGELKLVFKEYGSVRDVWVARNPPGFAFVSFDSFEDADDAVKALNGSTICGVRARVEHSNDRDRSRSQPLPPDAPPSHHLLPIPPPPPPPPPTDGAPIRPFHPVFPYGAMDPFAGRSDLEFWRRHFPFGLPTMMPLLMNKPSSTKVYVGDLPKDASEKELQRIFSVYGPLRDVWVARNPPGFAFVEFVSHHDADEAVRKLNGAIICGERVRVEHSTDRSRSGPQRNETEAPARPPFDDRLLMDFRPPIDFPPIRHPWPDVLPPREEEGQTISKVFIGNLPKDACSREIENAFRTYGPLRDVWVARNPPGFAFVEFFHFRDADDAVRRMDGEILCGGRIRVEHSYGPSGGRGDGDKRRPPQRSFSPSRSRSRSRSRGRHRVRAPRTPSPLSPRSRSLSRSSERSRGRRRSSGKHRQEISPRIYVGSIPKFATERDIEDAFRRFGPIRDVWVARNPPGFAFVDFASFRDAADAVRNSDIIQVCGRRVRVEHSTKRLPRFGGASTSRDALRSLRSRSSSLSDSKSSKSLSPSGRSASKSSSR